MQTCACWRMNGGQQSALPPGRFEQPSWAQTPQRWWQHTELPLLSKPVAQSVLLLLALQLVRATKIATLAGRIGSQTWSYERGSAMNPKCCMLTCAHVVTSAAARTYVCPLPPPDPS